MIHHDICAPLKEIFVDVLMSHQNKNSEIKVSLVHVDKNWNVSHFHIVYQLLFAPVL